MQHQPADLFRHAVALHQAGDLPQAEALYRQILAATPDHPDSLHLLGLLAHQAGHPEAGLTLIDRSIQVQPGTSGYHDTRGLVLKALGRLPEAIEAHRMAVQLQPRAFGPLYNLGNALYADSQFEPASFCYRQAILCDPQAVSAHNNLGNACRALGRPADAAEAFRDAVRLLPGMPELLFNLGSALVDSGALAEACAVLDELVCLQPDNEAAWTLFGTAWTRRGDWTQAAACLRRAVQALPNSPALWSQLGLALTHLNHPGEAAEVLRTALRRLPESPLLWSDLGTVMNDAGHLDEAAAACATALRLDPAYAPARYNLSVIDLTAGRFAAGWAGYEARWQVLGDKRHPPAGPAWDGGPAPGQVLTVFEEQGAGDYIQFCRLVPRLAERMPVTLRVPRTLHRLIGTLAGSQRLVVAEDVAADVQPGLCCSMMSLPRLLGLTPETLPAAPYLHPDPALAAGWHARLAALPGLRVGLAWAGNATYEKDHRRSIPGDRLAMMAGIAGVSFVSVQKGGASWTAPPDLPGLVDWTDELADFADTAALIAALDLVIGVDTAVVHLAGALGRPVWLLNRFDTDWRWMRDRADSLWYPSMRIFRQATPGDWAGVLAQVRVALTHRGPS